MAQDRDQLEDRTASHSGAVTGDGSVGDTAAEGALHDPSLYVNRELSLLAFQARVLEEAQDPRNPLLERVKFLSILGSNLAEFFMVRVAGLKQQVEAGIVDAGADGMTPVEQLAAIRVEVLRLMGEARRTFYGLLPELEAAGIFIVPYEQLDPADQERLADVFDETIFPVLTPLAFDPGRPFPHISSMSLSLAVLIREAEGADLFARVKLPTSLNRLVAVPDSAVATGDGAAPRQRLVWLEDVVGANLGKLFPGKEVLASYPFRVLRDAEMTIQELEAEDLLETIELGVRRRRFGSVVRVTVPVDMPPPLRQMLMDNLEVSREDVYTVERPLATSTLGDLYDLERPDLKYAPFVPAVPAALRATPDSDIFAAIRRQDILLHHPFDSFVPVVDFLRAAARDPDVLAIKATLYRVGRRSPIVAALQEAAAEGKQVACLVELKARFDEESNIEWARALEAEGVHVVYGLLGLKTHSKIALVVRREGDRIRRYLHLATGNYNPVTALLYTDLGMFTAAEEFGPDASDLFNLLTGYSSKEDYHEFLVAPLSLRSRLESLIEREIEHARSGREAHLVFKLNSLSDKPMIRLLYRASQAGVRLDLLVRGVCCLRPGIPGVSENIRVVSIVGRFLEHSRIYYFHNGGAEEVYLGSADLMSRNLDRRVEILFPVRDEGIIRHLRDDILATYLADTVKAREMQADGSYLRVLPGPDRPALDSQAWFIACRTGHAEEAGLGLEGQ